MRLPKTMKLILGMVVLSTLTFSGDVYIVTKYGKTGGIVGAINQTSDLVNGRQICPADPTAGCDFSDDPGYNGGDLDNQTDDTYSGDLLVRTNDVFEAVAGWRWNGTAAGADEKVTITGTLPANGWYEYTDLPGDCDLAESSISADRHTIVCVRKDFDKNDAGTYAEDLKFPVRVLGGTPSGTQPGDINFKLEDATGANVSEDNTDGHSLTVTAAPRWNLEKSMYTAWAGKEYDYNGDGTPDKGWIMDYKFYIESDEVTRGGGEVDTVNPIVGNESMGEDATFEFKDVLDRMPAGSTLVDCSMHGRYDQRDGYNGGADPISCIGAGCIRGDQYPERHILTAKDHQVITCEQPGGSDSEISIKVEHVDATLNHYPTKDYSGRDLPVNRAIAAIGNVYIFIPLESVEKGKDGIAGTADDGEYATYNKMTGFDPTTPTNHSNFAGETESEKDNEYGRTLYSARGDWSKYYRGTHHGLNDDHGVWAYIGSGYRSGDGMVNKGSEFSTALSRSNSGGTYLTEDTTCDVIDAYRMKIQAVQDNTVYTEIKTSYVGKPEWPFRYVIWGDEGNYTDSNGADGIPYIVEYATGYVDGAAFLPSLGADTTVDHGDAVLTECTDPNVQWTTDFATAAAGTDAQGRAVGVTKVRWRLKPGIEMNPGSSGYFFLNHKIREKDLVTNAVMNNNDLITDFATHKFDYQNEWSKPDYKPGAFPGTHSGRNGDRVIYTGAKVRIEKLENRSGAGLGDEIIYTFKSSYTNDTGLDGTGDVKIIDILPKAFTYKTGSAVTIHDPGKLNLEFGEPTIGTCQDAIDAKANYNRACIDGENQVLIWDLGSSVPINAPGIPDLNYTALIGAAANNGNNFNTTTIVSNTDGSPVSQRTSEIGVNISVPSSLIIVKKTVDNPDYLELRERTTEFKEIWFTMDVRSGYDADVHNVDIIDIIPFIGDGNPNALKFAGNQNQQRKINTDYHGEMYFSRAKFKAADDSPALCDTANVKFYYTNAVPGTIDQAPTVSDENKIGHANSIWCEGTEDGPNGCTIVSSGFTFPAGEDGLKAVTAVRAKGANMEPQAICQMWADVKVRNNLKGDNYSNTAGASANEITNPVLSNSVAAPVVGSSLGNRVWYDANKDGTQDSGESSIPGVEVHLLDNVGNAVNDPTTGQPYVVTTDANGNYLFDNLNFGEYKVQFVLPAGYAVSPKGSSGDNATDSDATLDAGNLTATTDVIALGLDEYNPNVDLGLNTPVISGHIFDDGDGDGNVTTTTPINKPDGVQLYATLLAEDGSVLATTPIAADGTYSFNGADGVRANSKYKVVLSTVQNAITSTLPTNWNNSGQQPSNTGSNGNDGNVIDGMITEIVVGITDVPDNDFGINHKPKALDRNEPAQINLQDGQQTTVPTLGATDLEDGAFTPKKIKITTLPDASQGVLYYNGNLVAAGDIIDNYDPSKLTVDPENHVNGQPDPRVVFTYAVYDKDGVESDPATVTMPFTAPEISGYIYNDGNGDNDVNGTVINKPDGQQLYVTLIDASGTIIGTKPVDDIGFYYFDVNDGIVFDHNYTAVLHTGDTNTTTPSLPVNWNNTGENINSVGTGNDGTPDGKINIVGPTMQNVAIPHVDFGINHKPVAVDVTEPSQLNPGGTTQVQVPDLNVSDLEDGTPTTVTIKTLPNNAKLYYDGIEITDLNHTISNFDPSKLTVDPDDGDQTVVFDYTTTDAAGVESDPATVTMPFTNLVISGNIFNDGNGDGDVNGTVISAPDGKQLHATLLDANGVVLATTPIAADGTYSFDNANGVIPNTDYTVVLATTANATASDLPTNWNNTGENINSAGTGNDGAPDGKIAVSVGTVDVPQIDFGINHKPVAVDVTEPSQLNPGGTTQVTVPNLNVSDLEDGTPTTVTIKTLPNNAKLYYDGIEITDLNHTISNFDPSKLTVDPDDGDQTVVFDYTTTDAAGVESDPATVTMPFTNLVISGNIFNDGNGDGDVNGTVISAPDGKQLHATLLDANGVVLATTPIAADGTYSFDNANGVIPNTDYTVVLATTANATASDLPTNWNNTGENINSAGTGNDGAPDGKIAVSVGTVDVPQIDFGINHKPVAVDVTEPSQLNPGGTTQVTVPNLNVSDLEDGTPTTVTIKTLPNNAKLYYDGIEITDLNHTISNFDPSKLTVDPDDGDQTVVFDYTTTDAAGVESDPATVTMPFTNLVISGNIFNDGNGDGDVNGTVISAPDGKQLHATLLDANGVVLATTPIAADGTYSFDNANGVIPNTDYTVVLATTANATASDLPTNWNNTGENINSAGTGNDGAPDGKIAVSVGTVDVPQIDFGINHKPVAVDVTEPSQLNPGGTTQVTVPNLNVSDLEDGTPTTVTIKTLPNNAKLYYDGIEITDLNHTISNFDPSKLTVDPDDGDQTVVFDYTTTDAAGVESDPATVTMPFTNLVISGNIFNDGNGDGDVNGTVISAPDGKQLHATLLDANGVVLATTPIAADGTYSFDNANGVIPNTDYTVVLATTANATASDLPTNWNNTGENINSAGTGNDGAPDGKIAVSVGTVDVPQIDFGINHKPVAVDVTEPSQLNPGGTTQVQVPDLNVSDREDGKPTTITIKDLPANATLYYDGQPVVAGTPIPNFDPTKLTVDPIDGDQTVVFDYTTTDAAGVESDPATVTMPFTNLVISGNIFNDGNGDGDVNGTVISAPDGKQLHATLLDANGVVLATTPIAADGTYSFDNANGVIPNTDYTVVLATTANATASDLPTNWNNTGENINSAGTGNDGAPDGKIAVSVGTVDVPQIDFGINKKPVATDVSKPIQNNPGGNTQVPVPNLDISDNEDGTPTTVTIKTLPNNGTLYYNGIPVTAGQVIPNFNPSKLTVDPDNGNVVIKFNYTTTDAAGVESDPATVTMPFNGDGIITGNVSVKDAKGNLNPIANVTLVLYNRNGTEVARTTTDSHGNYRFTVPPGNYYIQEAQPKGYYNVSENEGGSDNESVNKLLNTINATVGVGETDVHNDFVETKIWTDCHCAPTPVIPCAICTQGFYTIHSHNVKDHSAEVHWVDSYYEIAYDIYLNGKFIATVEEDRTRYTFKNLQSGTDYTAVIIANNGYGGKTKQTVKFRTTDSMGWLPAIYHILSN